MGSTFGEIGNLLGTLFSPIHTIFVYVFMQPVFNILMLIYQVIHNFGLAIIILTLLIRGSLYPLMRKQLASSRKMQELAPKLKQLQAQYRGDPQGLMQAQQTLYKEHGVSMYGGCLPTLIQLPFLYALYYSFFQVLGAKTAEAQLQAINNTIYPFLPQLTVPPDFHFLGMNLTQPSVVLAVIAALFTFAQMRMALPVKPASTGAGAADGTAQVTKGMQYVMPGVTLIFGMQFPAGLALYWAVSTLFAAVQQYLVSGWGSLFLGVPGMERFVPQPSEAPALPSGAGRTAAPRAGAQTPEQPERPAGIFGMLRQIREQAAQAAAAQEAARRQPGGGQVVEGTIVTEEDRQAQAEESAERKATGTTQREKRARQPKSGAMLVRPTDQAGGTGEKPEEAIAREAVSQPAPQEELPEERIAREATSNGVSATATREKTAKATAATQNGSSAKSDKQGKQGEQSGSRRSQQSRGRSRSRRSR